MRIAQNSLWTCNSAAVVRFAFSGLSLAVARDLFEQWV